jgi:hypothetical protein
MDFKPTSGLTRSGMRALQRQSGVVIARALEHESIFAKKLSADDRKSLPDSAFVFPERGKASSGSYPVHDRSHAANALSRAKGTPDFAAVKRKVCGKFGDLPECGGS